VPTEIMLVLVGIGLGLVYGIGSAFAYRRFLRGSGKVPIRTKLGYWTAVLALLSGTFATIVLTEKWPRSDGVGVLFPFAAFVTWYAIWRGSRAWRQRR
jgi:hypothetical protein